MAYTPFMTRFLRSVGAVVATSPQYRDSSPVLARFGDKVTRKARRAETHRPEKVASLCPTRKAVSGVTLSPCHLSSAAPAGYD